MKYTPFALLASAGLGSALTQACSGVAKEERGNWFCGAVDHILYQGFSGNGSFQAVTHMGSDGECRQEPKTYSGSLAPLNEGLSLHFRGPLHLKQFAVYNLVQKSKPKQKREEVEVEVEADMGKSDAEAGIEGEVKAGVESPRANAPHGHAHRHLHRGHRAKRADIVTATIDGKVVTWENNYFGPVATDKPTSPPPPTVQPGAGGAADLPKKQQIKGKPAPSGSDWDRVAYYNAQKQISENIMFMGNHGGQGSGVFDTVWGNSLSYLNADGSGGSSTPQILKDIVIPSEKEFSIFSAEKCDASCGFSRAPEIAYKGFSGANKVFLFEFKMPSDGKRCPNGGQRPGFDGCANPDMPAIWALNAAIPRSGQYSSCSCWKSGCGEADIYEVLAPGDTKCKSTFHMAKGAGSSDYFARPVNKFIKVATVFHADSASVSIRKIPDNVNFSGGLDDKTVLGWLNIPTDGVGVLSSLFQLLGSE